MLKAAERAQRTKDALMDIVKAVANGDDFIQLFNAIIKAGYALLRANRVTLFLVDDIKKELWVAISQDVEGTRVPFGRGIVGHVAQTGHFVNFRDVYSEPMFDPSMDQRTGYRTK